jgi:hypothetical protein
LQEWKVDMTTSQHERIQTSLVEAKDNSPRRKPWDTERSVNQAPEGRKKLPNRVGHVGMLVTALTLLGCSQRTTNTTQQPDSAASIVITVEAGAHDRRDTPISITLDGIGEITPPLHVLEITDDGPRPIPSQFEESESPRLWFIVSDIPAGSRRRYELRPGMAAADTHMTVQNASGNLEIRQGRSPVLRYNTVRFTPPAPIDDVYGRNGHIHPVWTPAGRIVTDECPPDHAHQSGIFFAFTKTEFEGRNPNFWDLAGKTGRVRYAATEATTHGPVYGGFRVRHDHEDLTAPSPKTALTETWDVRAWNIGGRDAKYRLFDITTSIRCATASPLQILKYHYGGMAIRGARGWTTENCRFHTADGKDRDGNHTRVRWVDIAGPAADTTAGVTVMTHPDNLRFPEPVRIHPTMPYMVYTPAHLGDWSIEPGHTHSVRYRYYVHDGDLDPETAERLWRDFAEPPVVRVETSR